MARARQSEKEVAEVQRWLGVIKAYETEFASWEKRVDKILKRYRAESSIQNRDNPPSHFPILWSNVQTLVPATYARLPKPDVSRRFTDRDPVGRVAALILERSLDFEIQHYSDYRNTLREGVYDRFLGGRATAWARYEPHVRAQSLQQPIDGAQVSEDENDPAESEVLDYECAPVDYVHWKDFGHTVARTWEEVTAVWRKVYMTRAACVERFGKEKGEKIPLDAMPEDLKRSDRENAELSESKRACVIELWDKTKKEALWISKSMKEIIDRKDDPLELEEFFPCPRPLYATLTNESLIPVPDFALYQDQADDLDLLSDRIDGLVRALQVKGVYDGSLGVEIARLFTDSDNTDLRAIKNWQSFAEKNGLKGAIDLVDLTPIAGALATAYEAFSQAKEQVYDITGIADIIRGQSKASETATAQQIKGQYAGLRLRDIQQGVALYATDLLRLKAQIVAGFDPQTLMAIAAVDQLAEPDKQYIPQALELLKDRPLRNFRVEVATDSLVQIDEQEEKENAVEFISGIGAFLEQASKVAIPALMPMIGELLKFAVARFKVGRQIEGVIDQAMEQLKQAGPPPDPEQMMEQVRGQVEQEMAGKKASQDLEHAKRSADLDIREMKFKAEQEVAKMECDMREQRMTHMAEQEMQSIDMKNHEAESAEKMRGERANFDEERSRMATEERDRVEKNTQGRDQALTDLVQAVQNNEAQTRELLGKLIETLNKPKLIRRDPQSGRAIGVEAA